MSQLVVSVAFMSATSVIKYPETKADGVLLRLREDYTQAVLDVFDKLHVGLGLP